MQPSGDSVVSVKVVGVGGAGGNAVFRMADSKLRGLDFLAINTDIQALRRLKHVPTFAIGPATTRGMGSGGNADLGRRAMRESQDQVSKLLEGADMVFIAAGMGGGTGTGAAAVIAEIARKQGALTVAVVTRPFSFEGPRRQAVAARGLQQLAQKVDTLIEVENDMLLASLDGKISIERAFRQADEILQQGVQGISEIITVPGLINVDFADVRAILANGGQAYMAVGEGKGKLAASQALQEALSNPLFVTPLESAQGILLNIKGGKDLSLGQVHEIADAVRHACRSEAHLIFGLVQDKKWNKRVSLTLVATGLKAGKAEATEPASEAVAATPQAPGISKKAAGPSTNGHSAPAHLSAHRMF